MPDAHVNLAASQVVTVPSPAISGTTLTVLPGHGARFPATPFNAVVFHATAVNRVDPNTGVSSEIVRVTGISTDTLTITRATEGSTARTIVVGDRITAGVFQGITAKALTDIEADVALKLAIASNLGDVASATTARTNLGATAGTWPDTTLTSPNNAVLKHIAFANSPVIHDQTAATLCLVDGGYAVVNPSISTVGATPVPVAGPVTFRFNTAGYLVGGKTQTLTLVGQVAANATAPGINFTFGLYPVTVAGAADTLTYTLGTVVSGSQTAINTPAASTITNLATSGIAVPSAGQYAFGCVTSGTLANNSAVQLAAQLGYVSG